MLLEKSREPKQQFSIAWIMTSQGLPYTMIMRELQDGVLESGKQKKQEQWRMQIFAKKPVLKYV